MSEPALPLSSDFQPLKGEANFGPPILREVVGGVHIAPECITVENGDFVMAEWPHGLPRHDSTRVVRFPHGLILYGETVEECAARLVREQLGMDVRKVDVLKIYSYMDDSPHWHIEPLLRVSVAGAPHPSAGVSQIIRHRDRTLPEGSVWAPGEFEKVHDEFFG